MTEIELGGLLEAAAKRYGHEGLLRVRSLNYEAYSGTCSVASVEELSVSRFSNGRNRTFPAFPWEQATKSSEPVNDPA